MYFAFLYCKTFFLVKQLKLAKILLVPPKCEIINSAILLFIFIAILDFIAPCIVIALNILCSIFGIISLLLFLIALPKVIAFPTIALIGDSKNISVKSVKDIFGKQHRKEAINQSSTKPIQKIKQRYQERQLLLSQSWWSNS